MNLPAVPADYMPLPTTGEAVDLTNPAEVAGALRALRAFKRAELDDAIKVLEAVLEAEMQRQGTKTLHYPSMTAKLVEKNETVYDVEALRASLTRAGCPEERIDELIKAEVVWKVDGQVARQLAAANEKYARALKRHKTVTPGYKYVAVK